MIIKHDYSISDRKADLVSAGLAKVIPHSFIVSHDFTREDQRTDEFCQKWAHEVRTAMIELAKQYSIHQLTEETSTMDHYRSAWDLYWYSNEGWNGKKYFDHAQISFNQNRTEEDNHRIFAEVLAFFETIEIDGTMIHIQYVAEVDERKTAQKAFEVFQSIDGKMINYHGKLGKIKQTGRNVITGAIHYGFFKKGARAKYYEVSAEELALVEV